VHSYAGRDGVGERIEFIMRAMRALGGMEAAPGGRLRFTCGGAHRAACKRLFIEASKLAADDLPEARPLTIHDRKSDCQISVASLGAGAYRVATENQGESQAEGVGRRLKAIAGGLRKLGEMTESGGEDEAAFGCGSAHDALVGMLLVRALNVRAVIREEDAAAASGVMAAPGAESV
jgi:hypothetical protein